MNSHKNNNNFDSYNEQIIKLNHKQFIELCKTGELLYIRFFYLNHEINFSTIYQRAIEISCEFGHLELLQWLLDKKPTDALTYSSEWAFTFACEFGHLHIAKWMYLHIPSLHIHINDELPFRMASETGQLHILKWLYECDTHINISAEKEDAFVSACENGHLETAQWLLYIKPTINISISNEEPFYKACKKGHLHVAKWLYHIKPTIHLSVHDEWILYETSERGHTHVFSWLLEIKNDWEFSNLSSNANPQIAKLIIQYKLKQKKWLSTTLYNQYPPIPCPICTESTLTCVITPCKHQFCQPCISTWLENHSTCPNCRNEI